MKSRARTHRCLMRRKGPLSLACLAWITKSLVVVTHVTRKLSDNLKHSTTHQHPNPQAVLETPLSPSIIINSSQGPQELHLPRYTLSPSVLVATHLYYYPIESCFLATSSYSHSYQPTKIAYVTANVSTPRDRHHIQCRIYG